MFIKINLKTANYVLERLKTGKIYINDTFNA